MTTEMTLDRPMPAVETKPTSGLGLAPVRPNFHRWPEDDTPVREERTPCWAEMFLLYHLGGNMR